MTRCFRGLLLLLSSSLWLPCNPCVFQSDASLRGWALAHSFWSRETDAQVARTLERSRFRRIGPHSARESALVAALLEVKSDGHWKPHEMLDQHREARDSEQDAGVEEVPWSLLRRSLWKRDRKGTSVKQNFLCDNLGIILALERCRSSHSGVLTQIRHFQSYFLALVSERTTVGFPLSSMRATVALARVRSKKQNWWHIFWTTRRVNCTVSVSNFSDHHLFQIVSMVLRNLAICPQPRQVRILSMHNFAHCGRVLKLRESSQIAMKVRKTSPTEFYIGSPTTSCADEAMALSGPCAGTNTPWSESSFGPDGRAKRQHWKSRGGRRGGRQRQLLRNLYPDKRQEAKSEKIERRWARRRSRVHADLLKSASADAMVEKLSVTSRTRMRHTQFREKLFSLLDLTEHTMMELADATLDQKMCRRATRLWEPMMAGFFDAFLAFSRMGVRELPRTIQALKAWPRLAPKRGKALMFGMLGGHL